MTHNVIHIVGTEHPRPPTAEGVERKLLHYGSSHEGTAVQCRARDRDAGLHSAVSRYKPLSSFTQRLDWPPDPLTQSDPSSSNLSSTTHTTGLCRVSLFKSPHQVPMVQVPSRPTRAGPICFTFPISSLCPNQKASLDSRPLLPSPSRSSHVLAPPPGRLTSPHTLPHCHPLNNFS